ncbi:MAG: hypothetical protein R3F30_04940 [Planctomycetota bacterium]
MRPRAAGLATLILLAAGCASAPEAPAPPAPAGDGVPRSPFEQLVLRDAGRREPLDRSALRGAWSVAEKADRGQEALRGDHPVQVLRDPPELLGGELRFVGTIRVGKVHGTEAFAWECVRTHLAARAQQLGGDVVVLVELARDPVSPLGYVRAQAAAYRYVPAGER